MLRFDLDLVVMGSYGETCRAFESAWWNILVTSLANVLRLWLAVVRHLLLLCFYRSYDVYTMCISFLVLEFCRSYKTGGGVNNASVS